MSRARIETDQAKKVRGQPKMRTRPVRT